MNSLLHTLTSALSLLQPRNHTTPYQPLPSYPISSHVPLPYNPSPACITAPPPFDPDSSLQNVCLSRSSNLRFNIHINTVPIPAAAFRNATDDLLYTCIKYIEDNEAGPGRATVHSTGSCVVMNRTEPYDPNACYDRLCINFGSKDGADFHIEEEIEALELLKRMEEVSGESGGGVGGGEFYGTLLEVKDKRGKALANVCVQTASSCGPMVGGVCAAPP